jgi:hypothetical protein
MDNRSKNYCIDQIMVTTTGLENGGLLHSRPEPRVNTDAQCFCLSPPSRTDHIRLSSITVENRPLKYLNVGVRELAKTKTLSH